jgi:hypothetical protein
MEEKYATKEKELLEIDKLLEQGMQEIIQRNKEQVIKLNETTGVLDSVEIYENGKLVPHTIENDKITCVKQD